MENQVELQDNSQPQPPTYTKGLFLNLQQAFGKENLPDEATFTKKITTDKVYRDGVHKNLIAAYGQDNVPDLSTFDSKVLGGEVKKKEPSTPIKKPSQVSAKSSQLDVTEKAAPITSELGVEQISKPNPEKAPIAPSLGLTKTEQKSIEGDIIEDALKVPELSNAVLVSDVDGIVTTSKDENAINQANILKQKIKEQGFDVDELVETFKDFPKELFNNPEYSKGKLLKLRQENPSEFFRTVASVKWQSPLVQAANAIKNNPDDSRSKTVLNDWNEILKGQQAGKDYQSTREHAKEIANFIYKYIDDTKLQDQIFNTVGRDIGFNYGEDIKGKKEILDSDPRKQYLNENELLGLQFLEDTNPKLANTFQNVLIDPNKLDVNAYGDKVDRGGMLGLQQQKSKLAEQGLALKMNYLSEEISKYQSYIKNGGQPTEDKVNKYNKYVDDYNNLQKEAKELTNPNNKEYGAVAKENLRGLSQELFGQSQGFFVNQGNKFMTGVGNTVGSLYGMIADVFRNQDEQKTGNLERIGRAIKDAKNTYTTQDNTFLKHFEIQETPEFTQQKNVILNDPNLTQEQKIEKGIELLSSNKGWEIKQLGGKANIKGLGYAIADTVNGLGQFILTSTALGGTGMGSKLNVFTSTVLQGYESKLQSNLQNNEPQAQGKALLSSLIDGALFASADKLGAIKKLFNPETPVGKVVSELSEAELNKMVNSKVGFSTALKSILESGKHSAPMVAAGVAGTIANDALLGQIKQADDYLKEGLVQQAMFTLVGVPFQFYNQAGRQLSQKDFAETLFTSKALEKMGLSGEEANNAAQNYQKALKISEDKRTPEQNNLIKGVQSYIEKSKQLPTETIAAEKPTEVTPEVKPIETTKSISEFFSNAGEKAKSENKPDALADFLLTNSKIGDTITDKNGEGYEVTEINTRKDGTKELILVPFELIDGKKEYNYSGTRLISDTNKKQAADLYEFSYTNSKGERVNEKYNYNTTETKPTEVTTTTITPTEVKTTAEAIQPEEKITKASDFLQKYEKGSIIDSSEFEKEQQSDDSVIQKVFNLFKDKIKKIKISGKRETEGAAFYDLQTKQIDINKNSNYWKDIESGKLINALVHEHVHHLIDEMPDKQEIENNLLKIKEDLINNRPQNMNENEAKIYDYITYKNSSPQEIITYAVSNPEMRKFLSKYSEDLNKISNKVFGENVIPSEIINKELKIEEKPKATLFSKPLEDAKKIFKKYADKFGIKYAEPEPINKIDKERAKKIADAYEAMKNEPNNPEVKKAYEAMAKETIDQFKQILEDGYEVEINNEEPYESSKDMIDDLRDNKKMRIFSTESGFGDEPITEKQRNDNPLLKDSGFKDKNGKPLLVNDVFRFVHDFFGHAHLGNGFGAVGEENAWNVHSRMYSPLARKAMTTETRGQNSWVNFSGVNDAVFKLRDEARKLRANGDIEGAKKLTDEVYAKMKFAEQKIGLLPDEFTKTDEELKPKTKTVADTVADDLFTHLGIEPEVKPEVAQQQLVEKTKSKVDDVKNALSAIAPDIKIEMHETVADTEASARKAGLSEENIQESKKAGGYYNPNTNTIHLNLEKIKSNTLFHEGVHPILNAINAIDSKAVDKLFNQVKTIEKRLGLEKKYTEDFASIYEKDQQSMEAVTEFLADVVDGKIKITETNFDKVKQFFVDMMKAVGIDLSDKIKTIQDLKKLADSIAEGFEKGQEIKLKNISEIKYNQEFQPIKNNGDVGDVNAAGKIEPKNVSDAKVGNINPLFSKETFKEVELSDLPVKSLKEKLDEFDNKAIAINSDPTKVGKVKMPSGKEIFLYGGARYSSIKSNVEGEIGFSSTNLGKPKQVRGAIERLFPEKNGEGLVLVTTQKPESMKGNAYSLEYTLDALSTLPKAILKSSEFKNEFFGKDIVAIKDAFGENKYNDFIKKYGRSDFSNPEVFKNMTEDLLNNVGSNFMARNSLIDNMLAGIVAKDTRVATKGEPGYISVDPKKYIAKELFNRLGLNQEKLFYELGEKGIVDAYMNDGKWGFVTNGFTSDSKIDHLSIQDKGVVHPQFNAKFHGKDPFFLDGAYMIDKLFLPEEMVTKKGDIYVKKASLMVAGSMYPKGKVELAEKEIEKPFTQLPITKEIQYQKPTKGVDLVENAGKRKEMTEDDKGNYLFFHYSDKKFNKLSPEKVGTHLATGRDERTGIPTSSLYTRPDRLEPNVPSDFGYITRVPKEKVYSFNADPLNLMAEAEAKFKKENKDRAFDANNQFAYVAKVAAEKGFPVTVAEWNMKGTKALIAKTTEALPLEKYTNIKPGTTNQIEFAKGTEDIKANAKRRDIQLQKEEPTTKKLEKVSIEPIDFENESENIDVYEASNAAEKIAKDNGVNILRGKDLRSVALDKKGNVIGGLWTEIDGNEFSFDIAIDKIAQGKGVGEKLVNEAISEFNAQDYEGQLKYKIDVTNPIMEKLLSKYGFEVVDKIYGHTIMEHPTNNPKLKPEFQQKKSAGEVKFQKESQDSKIIDFIEMQREKGISDEDIRAGLEKAADRIGLDKNKIEELLTSKKEEYAVQKPSPEGVLQPTQEGVGKERGERAGMEQAEQGAVPPKEGKPSEAEVGGAEKKIVYTEAPKTAAKVSELNRVREEFGLPEFEPTEEVSTLRRLKNVENTIADLKKSGKYEEEIKKIKEKAARNEISDEGQDILTQRLADLRATAKTLDRYSPEYDKITAQIKDVTDTLKAIGTIAGRTLEARKHFVKEIETVHDIEENMLQDRNAPFLTKAEKDLAQQKFDEYQKINEAAEKALQAKNEELAKLKIELEEEKAKNELSKQQKAVQKTTPKTKDDYKKEREAIKQSIKDKWNNAGKDIISMDLPYRKQLAAITPEVSKLVYSYLEQAAKDPTISKKVKDIIEFVKKELKEFGINVSDREALGLVSGEYMEKQQTRNELSKERYELQKEADLLSKIDDLQNDIVKEKDIDKQRKKATVLKDLEKQLDDLQKQMKVGKYSEEAQFEATAKQQISANKKKIEEIQQKIKKGDFAPETKKESILLNEELQKKKPEIYNKWLETQTKKEDWQKEYEYSRLKQQAKNLSLPDKIAMGGRIALNTYRTAKATGEISTVLVQNIIPSLNNPRLMVKFIYNAFKNDLLNGKKFKKEMAILKNSELGDLLFDKMKIALYEPMGIREEAMNELLGGNENLLNKTITIGGKKYSFGQAFERLVDSYANNLRIELASREIEYLLSKGKTWENAKEEYIATGRRINEESGHGKLAQPFQNASKWLNMIIWSTKMMSSTFNVLGMGDLIRPLETAKQIGREAFKMNIPEAEKASKGYYTSLTPRQRMVAARNLGQFAVTGLGIMGVIKLLNKDDDDVKVTLNPFDSNFGIKIGDKQVNPFGRYASYMTGLLQVFFAMKYREGEKKPLGVGYKAETSGDVAFSRFVRGKMRPDVGLAYDYVFNNGKNYFTKERIKPSDLAPAPMTWINLFKDIKRDKISTSLWNVPYQFIGGQVRDQRNFEESKATLKEESAKERNLFSTKRGTKVEGEKRGTKVEGEKRGSK